MNNQQTDNNEKATHIVMSKCRLSLIHSIITVTHCLPLLLQLQITDDDDKKQTRDDEEEEPR